KRVIQPLGMVDELRRCFPLDAYDAAIGMIEIGIETDHPAIFHGGDRGTVSSAKRAVTAHLFYFVYGFCWFGHHDLSAACAPCAAVQGSRVQKFKEPDPNLEPLNFEH